MAFNFKASWQKGITNHASDALSHNPVSMLNPEELLAESDEDNNQLQRLGLSTGIGMHTRT